MTPKEIRNYIFDKFDSLVSCSWHVNFIKKNSDKIAYATAYPQEEVRLTVSKDIAKKHISNLKKYIENVPTELIINIDEACSGDWIDSHPKLVIVPIDYKNRRVQYSVKRNTRKITMCAAISMAGDAITPMIISDRKNLDKEIAESGFREGQDFVYYYQNRCYITKDIFLSYISETIIPYIKSTRDLLKLNEFPAVILMDNCSAHMDESVLDILAENNIRVITFPPHTTNLFQPLDLVTFRVFKQEKRASKTVYKKGSLIDRFHRNIMAIEKATISSNNKSAFYRAGLKIQGAIIPNIAIVREQYLLDIIDQSNLSDNSFDGSKTKFGYINKEQMKKK